MPNSSEPGVAPVVWARGLHTGSGETLDVIAYDRYLGRWSRLFLPALLQGAEIGPRDRVLDVGTGPGDGAIAVRDVVGGGGVVIGCDVAMAMVRAAHDRAQGTFAVVTGDAQRLPFGDGAFGAVVCQLGLMFFPNPRDALIEFARVVRPGGRVAVGVVSTAARAPMWGVLAGVLSDHLPAQHDAFHQSFSLADPVGLLELFKEAGYGDAQVTRQLRDSVFESLDDYWVPIERGVGQLPHAYRCLPDRVRRRVHDEVNDRLSAYWDGHCLVMSVEVLIATGHVQPHGVR